MHLSLVFARSEMAMDTLKGLWDKHKDSLPDMQTMKKFAASAKDTVSKALAKDPHSLLVLVSVLEARNLFSACTAQCTRTPARLCLSPVHCVSDHPRCSAVVPLDAKTREISKEKRSVSLSLRLIYTSKHRHTHIFSRAVQIHGNVAEDGLPRVELLDVRAGREDAAAREGTHSHQSQGQEPHR